MSSVRGHINTILALVNGQHSFHVKRPGLPCKLWDGATAK